MIRRRAPLAFGGWSAPSVLDVLTALRPEDRREAYATRAAEDPFALFAEFVAAAPQVLLFEVAYRGDLCGPPLAFYGVWHRSPGVGAAAMLATAELTAREAAAMAERVRRVAIPDMIGLGLRRVDCQRMESHRGARAFLRACGATEAAEVRREVGRRGEDFREHYWLASEIGARLADEGGANVRVLHAKA